MTSPAHADGEQPRRCLVGVRTAHFRRENYERRSLVAANAGAVASKAAVATMRRSFQA